jgi:hypothetical protein
LDKHVISRESKLSRIIFIRVFSFKGQPRACIVPPATRFGFEPMQNNDVKADGTDGKLLKLTPKS